MGDNNHVKRLSRREFGGVVAAGAALFAVEPLAAPVTLASLAHAWVIPELYAQRGANVVRRKPGRASEEA